jgi:thioredoxin-like negative regulator of GroEL
MGWLSKLLGGGAAATPVSVDDGSFDREVAGAALPVLLDVWGPACAPCKQLEPVIMDLARRYEGRIKVCELNARQSPRTAARLGVRGTPTVLYFRDGKELERVVGFRSSLYHRQAIEELFGIPS